MTLLLAMFSLNCLYRVCSFFKDGRKTMFLLSSVKHFFDHSFKLFQSAVHCGLVTKDYIHSHGKWESCCSSLFLEKVFSTWWPLAALSKRTSFIEDWHNKDPEQAWLPIECGRTRTRMCSVDNCHPLSSRQCRVWTRVIHIRKACLPNSPYDILKPG